MNNTVLALGLGAIGIYVVWRLAAAKQQQEVVAPPKTLQQTLDQAGAAIVTTGLNRVKKAFVELATGTSGDDTFKLWNEESDFSALKFLMCSSYHQGIDGNNLPARAAQQMAPGLRVAPGDADCNPTNPSPNIVRYYDSHGGPYETRFGSKELATLFTTPWTKATLSSRPRPVTPLVAGAGTGGGSWTL